MIPVDMGWVMTEVSVLTRQEVDQDPYLGDRDLEVMESQRKRLRQILEQIHHRS